MKHKFKLTEKRYVRGPVEPSWAGIGPCEIHTWYECIKCGTRTYSSNLGTGLFYIDFLEKCDGINKTHRLGHPPIVEDK